VTSNTILALFDAGTENETPQPFENNFGNYGAEKLLNLYNCHRIIRRVQQEVLFN
jgi:hypothetical protein